MAKKETKASRTPTRRQVALSRKEKEQQKLVYMGLGLVAALILIALAVGLFQTFVLEPNSPVAVVNGEEISTQEYQDQTLLERFVLDDQLQQVINELGALPPAEEGEDQLTQLIRNQYQQYAQQISQQRSLVDRQALDNMIVDKLIAAEAAQRGITVPNDEVTEAVNQLVAGRQGGVTAASATETVAARAEASATAAGWTPTPTLTPSPTLTSTDPVTPVATPIPQPTATLNIIGQDELATQNSNWLAVVTGQTGLTETQYREFIRMRLLRTKLAEALGEEVPRTAEHANSRHILVETEEEANDVIARLKAGEDFAALAKELSTDPGSGANGGELGSVPKGRFVAPVEEAIFSLPIGQVSDPVESQFGWHVIEVLERGEQELSPANYSQAQQAAFSDWLVATRNEAVIEDFWDKEKAPADEFLGQQPQ